MFHIKNDMRAMIAQNEKEILRLMGYQLTEKGQKNLARYKAENLALIQALQILEAVKL